jgi:transcription initiation factor TFIID subunit 12
MMRNINFLAEEEKAKYEKGLASLWKVHDNAAPGSHEQNEAKKKIGEFGKMLVAKLHQRRQQQLQQQQQQQQQPPPQQQQSIGQPGQGPAAPPAPQPPAAAAPTGNAGNNAPSQASAAGAQASPNLAAAASQGRVLPPHILSHLSEMQFQAPPTVQDKAKWLEDVRQKYAKALYSMETARTVIKSIDQTLQDNQSVPAEEKKKLEERKALLQKQYTEAVQFANNVRKQYAAGGNQRPAQNGSPTANAPNQARPPTAGAQNAIQPGQGASNGAAQQSGVNAAAVNAAMEAAKKQQLAAGRMQPGAMNAVSAQQQGPQGQQSPVTQAAPTQPATSQTQPQQPATAIKIEPGTQSLPAPINTAIASAAAAGGMPSAGTPTQNSARLQTPQSATPTTANANIRPLTHAAAVNLASQPRPGALPAAASGPGIAGAPASGLGVVGGGPAQQQQGHPHAHPAQQQQQAQPTAQNLQSKLPIPKVLPEKATQIPTPVPNIGGIGAGRPTYSGGGGIGGGVMNQPALPKTPAYQLEGEGERILNKKKLDELVRQVCGGTAEGQEGNLLTPEVEEVSGLSFIVLLVFRASTDEQTQSILNMADSFLDNVINQACRNAKERGSKVLEIRDMQLVLERTYNIRIPGYSSEELRTVRKVQPNSSWIKKMSAVQAAKVVPGKGDL